MSLFSKAVIEPTLMIQIAYRLDKTGIAPIKNIRLKVHIVEILTNISSFRKVKIEST